LFLIEYFFNIKIFLKKKGGGRNEELTNKQTLHRFHREQELIVNLV
jgi:hypothetical protein